MDVSEKISEALQTCDAPPSLSARPYPLCSHCIGSELCLSLSSDVLILSKSFLFQASGSYIKKIIKIIISGFCVIFVSEDICSCVGLYVCCDMRVGQRTNTWRRFSPSILMWVQKSNSQVSGQVPLPIGACPQLLFELEITMSTSQESF